MGRRLRWLVISVVVVAAAGALAERRLERRLETSFREILTKGKRDGSLERVEVCLPCLSYTIHGVRFALVRDGQSRPLLDAPAVDVSIDPAQLLRGAARGRIRLHDATLHLDVGNQERDEPTVFEISWEHIGRGMLPVPIARIEADASEVIVDYDRLKEPVRWHFLVREGLADNLAPADGEKPTVLLRGATPGDGDFELRMEVHPESETRSTLVARLSQVPLVALDTYIRHRVGLDVESGLLSAAVDLKATRRGWSGYVDCEVVDLDVFDAADLVEHGPVQATRDAVAGIVTQINRSSDDVLRMRIDVDEKLPKEGEDEWEVLAEALSWLLLTPFTAPFALVPGSGVP